MSRTVCALSLGIALSGCFGEPKPYPSDASDAVADVRAEAAVDAAVDAPVDASTDASLDARDAAVDAAPDGAGDGAVDGMDAADVIDAADDSPDVMDAGDAMDAPDGMDASDAARDVSDASDAARDVSDASDAARDVSDGGDGGEAVDPAIGVPRLVAPLSVSRVVRRVRFEWINASTADGATIEVCRDRACTVIEASAVVTGESIAPTVDLAPGFHWWRARGRRGRINGTIATQPWEFYVTPRRPGFDVPTPRQWGAMFDANGDGLSDLVVGAPTATAGGVTGGAAYVFAGSGFAFATTPSTTFAATATGANFGRRVSPLDDVNGDGFADLAVSGGASTTVYAGGTGVPSSLRVYDGWSRAQSAGDVNHDGYGDVLVSDGARVGVMLGGSGGPALAAVRLVTGSAAVSVGDLNGDRFDDLAVQTATTRITVYLGNLAGFDATAAYTLDAPAGYTFSNVTAAGDVNGDSLVDLIATATPTLGTITTGVVLPLVPPGTRVASPVLLTAPSPRPNGFGVSVAGVGDFNGDGVDDFAVGASSDTASTNQVCVYAGSITGPATNPTQCLVVSAPPRFAASVAGTGDVNNDGFEDLVVGAPGSSTVRGAVTVYRGRAAGLTDPMSPAFTAGDTAGGFGTDLGGWR